MINKIFFKLLLKRARPEVLRWGEKRARKKLSATRLTPKEIEQLSIDGWSSKEMDLALNYSYQLEEKAKTLKVKLMEELKNGTKGQDKRDITGKEGTEGRTTKRFRIFKRRDKAKTEGRK